MKTPTKITLLATLMLANIPTVLSQQPDNSKSVPSMSSDGIMTNKAKPTIGWKRYSPEGFGLSLELPGEPLERPYFLPDTLKSEIKKTTVLDYLEDNLEVDIAYLVFKKPLNLRSQNCSKNP